MVTEEHAKNRQIQLFFFIIAAIYVSKRKFYEIGPTCGANSRLRWNIAHTSFEEKASKNIKRNYLQQNIDDFPKRGFDVDFHRFITFENAVPKNIVKMLVWWKYSWGQSEIRESCWKAKHWVYCFLLLIIRCLVYSKIMMDAETWTLRERTTPNCGISTMWSNMLLRNQ